MGFPPVWGWDQAPSIFLYQKEIMTDLYFVVGVNGGK